MQNEWPLKSMKRGNVKENAITFVDNLDELAANGIKETLKKVFF